MLSIIIPTFNEEENIDVIYKEIKKLNINIDYEICFIDDGSTDKSLINIEELSNSDSKVKCISFSKNFGHQLALCAGIERFKNNDILMLDCDLQHPTKFIPQMIIKLEEGYDIIQMSKIDQGDRNLLNKFLSYIFYKTFRFISGIKIANHTSDFRLISKKVSFQLSRFKEKEKFYRAIIQLVGFKYFEIKYKVGDRIHGKSKYGFSELAKLASFGMFGFSSLPLKISFYIGSFISILSFLYGVYAIYIRFFSQFKPPIGYTDLIVMVTFLGGLQLVFLGLIGMYLSKVLDQTRDRPAYIIDKEI